MNVRVGIIGGSIAGCAAGAALQRVGIDVTVFERSTHAFDERGAGINLPTTLVDRLRENGLIDEDIPYLQAQRRPWFVLDGDAEFGRQIGEQQLVGQQHHWGVVFQNLRRRVDDERYVRGSEVVEIEDEGESVSVGLADGSRHQFDLVLGADGYRSTIRSRLFPNAQPRYAGYPAWRGMLEERECDGAPLDGAAHTVGIERAHAVFYLVPGEHGDLRPGHRRLNWLIYDGAAPPEVTGSGAGGQGRLSVDSIAPGGLRAEQLRYLHEVVGDRLPPWHRNVLRLSPEPYAQNVYDLSIDHYVQGRVCLVGDASTIARPHTGSGAAKAMDDSLTLADALASAPSIDDALSAYEQARVPAGQVLVALGERLGREQVLEAPMWSEFDTDSFAAWIAGGSSSQSYQYAKRD